MGKNSCFHTILWQVVNNQGLPQQRLIDLRQKANQLRKKSYLSENRFKSDNLSRDFSVIRFSDFQQY